MEPFYPLHAWVCHECFLVQINDYVSAAHIFDECAYFSSFSSTWLSTPAKYVASMTERLSLGADNFVVELASNDGYLLQYFVERGVPCLGIEPAQNVATAASRRACPPTCRSSAWRRRRDSAAGKLADLVDNDANVLLRCPT